MTKQELHAHTDQNLFVRCRDRKPGQLSRPTIGSSHRAIRAPIHWWPSAGAASAWRTWTATSFSTLPRALPWFQPAIAILRWLPRFRNRRPN